MCIHKPGDKLAVCIEPGDLMSYLPKAEEEVQA